MLRAFGYVVSKEDIHINFLGPKDVGPCQHCHHGPVSPELGGCQKWHPPFPRDTSVTGVRLGGDPALGKVILYGLDPFRGCTAILEPRLLAKEGVSQLIEARDRNGWESLDGKE